MEENDWSDLEDLMLLWALYRKYKRFRRRPKRFWVRPIFSRRKNYGSYGALIQEMCLSDVQSHFRYFRMSKERFNILLQKVGPALARQYSSCCLVRPEITPAERLSVGLRYLATGNSQASLSFEFRMGKSTICGIVKEVSEAIWNALSEEYVKLPCTQTEWLAVSREYEQMWNFPNCLGAIDGKHVVIQALKRSGSTHYNYKGTHSVVLLAVCDAHYRFIMIDVGDAGHHSDSGVFSNSDFGQALLNDCLCLPQDRALPGTTSPKVPYCFVGDEAFPLKPNMMRPYPGKNLPYQQSAYNYRLCRARRVIENSFGILAARWRIFRRPIIAEPENVVLFTKAAVALYNYLRTTESSVHCPAGFTDAEDGCGNVIRGDWRDSSSSNLQQVRQLAGNRYTASAASVREAFTD